MKKLLLALTMILVVTLTLVSCNKLFEDIVKWDEETIAGETDNTTIEDTVSEEKTDVITTEEQTSEIVTDEIVFNVDLDSIVKGGKVVKKHDPYIQVWSETMRDYRVHLGIDIECALNAPVYSMVDGEVTKIWYDTFMGNCVAVSNGTYVVIYKNLSDSVADGIAEGATVTKGQWIGNVGDTAIIEIADAPHLHLEITKDDLSVDPLEYISINGEVGNGTETEIETDKATDETTATEIVVVELDSIVKGGKVAKKHDPDLLVWSPTMGDYRVHIGIDITCEENSPVYAMFDGEVTKIWSDSLMGNCIAISNGTYVVIYKNLADNTVEGIIEGAKVTTYQMIGYVGDSALVELADESHLHLELTKNDLSIDPLEYITGEVKDDDETETETEEITEETNEEIVEVELDSIVKSGKVVKKHDPYIQVWSETMGDYRVHLGIDIECALNAPVYSMVDGKVTKVWYDTLMGNCVAVSNGTYVVIYKNLSDGVADGIAEGATVTKGQWIGNVGDTAMIEIADAPHLHLEITKDDLSVDPLEYIVE